VFLLRLLAVLALIVVLLGGLAFVVTGQRRYLDITWRFCRYAMFIALFLFSLLVFERLASMAI